MTEFDVYYLNNKIDTITGTSEEYAIKQVLRFIKVEKVNKNDKRRTISRERKKI